MKTGDHIDEAIDKVFLKEYEQALVQISIAIDGTSKRKYGSNGVAARMKKFVRDNETFITNTALNGQVTVSSDATTYSSLGKFDNVIYKVIRCPLLHGDDISQHIVYLDECRMGLDDGKFIVTPLLLWGLIFSVIGEVVNSTQILKKNHEVQVGGIDLNLNDFWGKMDKLKDALIERRQNRLSRNFHGS